MSFNETFVINNNTSYDLVLDTVNSQNLDDAWPTSVPAYGNLSFPQSASLLDINPTAIYQMQGANPANSATLHFYCAGVGLTVQVTVSLKYSGTFIAGSSISETNTQNGGTTTSTPNGDGYLEISDFGNNSSRGTATFTLGS